MQHEIGAPVRATCRLMLSTAASNYLQRCVWHGNAAQGWLEAVVSSSLSPTTHSNPVMPSQNSINSIQTTPPHCECLELLDLM
jgi:hypothetical protein